MVEVSDKLARLERLGSVCRSCKACRLYQTRSKVVVGEGSPDAVILFIGEGPGKEEDLSGRPFVGRSGQLLRKMIRAIKLDPEKDCFIANIVKCRPPANRPPERDEIDCCVKFLKKQIEVLAPPIIVLLGKTAVKGLLPELGDKSMYDLRGMGDLVYEGIQTLVTYHPSALLRDPKWHKSAIEDFRQIEIRCSDALFRRKTLEGENLLEDVPY